MATDAKPVPRPDLNYGLQVCYRSLAYYEAGLKNLSDDDLREYAASRMLRDQYIHQPKQLATHVRSYLVNYHTWWEQWRKLGQ